MTAITERTAKTLADIASQTIDNAENSNKLALVKQAIREIDAGSCNGCELEIHALNNAYYDVERFGLRFVASPRHADVLMVTGPVTRNMRDALLRTLSRTLQLKYSRIQFTPDLMPSDITGTELLELHADLADLSRPAHAVRERPDRDGPADRLRERPPRPDGHRPAAAGIAR